MNTFDIIVPTFNRYKTLSEFFKNNESLESSDAHFWIIDDCSTEYIDSVIPTWPNLTFIRLPENKGQAHARNIALERGTAPYVISLDDDAWFDNGPFALSQIAMLFSNFPDAGCLMFNIATPAEEYSQMLTGTKLQLHVTCGCAYRREVLKVLDGFSGFLHSQAEETDLSMRIYQANWNIRFSNEIKVFHNFSPGLRPLSWYLYVRHNTTRNELLIVVMRYPLLLILPFLAGKFVSHLRYAIRNRVAVTRTLFQTMRAALSFIRLCPIALKNRKALSMNQFRYWRKMNFK